MVFTLRALPYGKVQSIRENSTGTELDNSGFKKELSRLGGIASGAEKGITAGAGIEPTEGFREGGRCRR